MVVKTASGYFGKVPCIKIKDGVLVRFEKDYYINNFINSDNESFKRLLMEFDMVIKNIEEDFIYIQFKEKN